MTDFDTLIELMKACLISLFFLISYEPAKAESCLADYQKLQCDTYRSNVDLQKKLKICRRDEKVPQLPEWEPLVVCKDLLPLSAKEFILFTRRVPANVRQEFPRARKICAEKIRFSRSLKYNQKTTSDLKTFQKMESQDRNRDLTECIDQNFVRLEDPRLPAAAAFTEFLDEVARQSRCFQPEAAKSALCPVISQVAPLYMQNRNAVSLKAPRFVPTILLGTRQMEDDSDIRLLDIRRHQSNASEARSVSQQEDMLALLRNQGVRSRLMNVGISLSTLENTVTDSKRGRLEFYKKRMCDGSSASRQFLSLLQGKGKAPEAGAFREALHEMGFANRTVLPSHLTPQEIESVLKKNPIFLEYLHELPGLQFSFEEYREGAITKDEVKRRMKALLFHHGPHNLKPKNSEDSALVQALKNSTDVKARTFLQGTIFEGPSFAGVVSERSPASLSGEGLLLSMTDKLGDATRNGAFRAFEKFTQEQTKIDPEYSLGSLRWPGGDGLQLIHDLLVKPTPEAQDSLVLLKNQTKIVTGLSPAQRQEISAMIDQTSSRLDLQSQFIQQNVRFEPKGAEVPARIRSTYIDEDGQMAEFVFRKETPASEAKTRLEAFFRSEEKKNGDPFRDFDGTSGGKSNLPGPIAPAGNSPGAGTPPLHGGAQ